MAPSGGLKYARLWAPDDRVVINGHFLWKNSDFGRKLEKMSEKTAKLTKEEQIRKEVKKMHEVFSAVSPDALKIADPLIERCAFMQISLKELESLINQHGYTEIYQNGENQKGVKKSSEVDIYNQLMKNYVSGVKALLDLLPKNQAPNAANDLLEEAMTK